MTAVQRLAPWWRTRAPRERAALVLLLLVLVGAALWFLSIAPSLRTVRTAPVQIAQLERQWLAMQTLAAEARALQASKPPSRDEALRALEAAVQQRLGTTGQLNVVGERATVLLRAAPPQALAPWLNQARLQARVVASQASLNRTATGWDGTVVFLLPPAP